MHSYSVQIQSVLYHNKKEALIKALDSLANAIAKSAEGRLGAVTVSYGDASKEPIFTDCELEALTKKYAARFQLKYTYFNKNTGTAEGHNRLGADCTAEYMLIMNPDVVVCPHLFDKMILPFEDPQADAGMVEARQSPVEHPKEYNKLTLETGWASTACALFPTAIFREIKGFDQESFFMYCDDLDFSWRIRLLGKKIYYRADCPVYHAKELSATGAWMPTRAEAFYSAQAALIMAYKWSNDSRLETLYQIFSTSSDRNLKDAAEYFTQLKNDNRLPERLDPEQKVATFVGDYYTEHRFVL